MATVSVRKVTSEEIPSCLEIRRLVFRVGMNVPEDIELDGLENDCQHFLAFVSEKPAGTCRLRPVNDGQLLKLERVAVLEEFRGQNIGKSLCRAAFAYQKLEHPEALLKTHAQKLGMIIASDPFYEADIKHYLMILPPEKKEDLNRLKLWQNKDAFESKTVIETLIQFHNL